MAPQIVGAVVVLAVVVVAVVVVVVLLVVIVVALVVVLVVGVCLCMYMQQLRKCRHFSVALSRVAF